MISPTAWLRRSAGTPLGLAILGILFINATLVLYSSNWKASTPQLDVHESLRASSAGYTRGRAWYSDGDDVSNVIEKPRAQVTPSSSGASPLAQLGKAFAKVTGGSSNGESRSCMLPPYFIVEVSAS